MCKHMKSIYLVTVQEAWSTFTPTILASRLQECEIETYCKKTYSFLLGVYILRFSIIYMVPLHYGSKYKHTNKVHVNISP